MKRFCLIILIFISYFSVAQKNITLEDIWKNKTFKTEALNSLQTLNDGEHYCIVKGDSLIIKLSYKNPDKQTVLFDSYGFLPKDSLKDRHIDMFIFSADEKKMLIAFNIKAKYRRSFLAEFYVFDLEKNKLLPLADNEKIQAPSFSPDGTKVAYVKNNNLFIFDIENKTTFQVTDDGKENEIINGAVDWVYEEEFSISTGFVWSPNSERIAYYRFDETRVKEFSFALYGNIYPEEYTYKYPKAGEQNSIAELRIFDLNSRNIIKVDVGTDTDQYLPRIYWFSSDNFVFMKLNRKQNEMALVSWQHNVAQNIYTEQTDTYIDVELTNVLALNKGENFLITSEKNGYNHVYLYKITGEKISVLTTGNWDILKMYGVNEKKQLLYFQASKDHEINKNIYTLHLKTKEITALTPDKGQNDAYFNENYSGFINVWSDANTPPVYRLCDAKGKVVKVLQNNDTLKKRMAEFGFVPKTFGTITVADSIMLNYWMMQPADFDSSKKYPVFVCQYSGPGSQQVLNRYGGSDFVWYQLLAQKGYIVLCIDARGTGARGANFKKATYLNLGKLESEDIIAAAKIIGDWGFVDKTRIGIWGWSYGGYMSSLCLFDGADIFKMAIAVAPVADWRYYNTIYTERYMQKPIDNPAGYDNYSLIKNASKLKGKYLLIHGSADDNVHFQNTMDLITALNKAGKQYDIHIYPNKNHAISGASTRLHLYTKMTDFILKNL